VLVDFLKPQPVVDGLNLIQWSCVAGLAVLFLQWAIEQRTHRIER
jgi:hypothetical protein